MDDINEEEIERRFNWFESDVFPPCFSSFLFARPALLTGLAPPQQIPALI
jgi:hypothetical protein